MLRAVICLVAGCYSPSPAVNAPCSEDGLCPTGLICDLQSMRCVREASDAGADGVGMDAPTDGPIGATFLDDFQRADGNPIGNGWIEKNPDFFGLMEGLAFGFPTGIESYRDNVVYRPASENVLDVEIAAEFGFLDVPRFAQVFARASTATITTPNTFDAYMLYVNGADPSRVVIGRQRGSVFVEVLASFTVTPAIVTKVLYRMTLRVNGTSPVALSALVEQQNGAAWIPIGSTTIMDADPARLTAPGSVGFSADEQALLVYDNFRRTAL